MSLLAGPVCLLSHCCRIVMLDKDVEYSVEYYSADSDPARVGEHNPYGETPTLVDRELSLYDPAVIVEYLDERFPHPPLMPVDPITRAKTRLMISRLTRDWLKPISDLGDSISVAVPAELAKSVHDGLVALSPLFNEQAYFLGNEYTLVDAYMAPLLWRVPSLGIELPKQTAPLNSYADRLFKRTGFTDSLSPVQAEMR